MGFITPQRWGFNSDPDSEPRGGDQITHSGTHTGAVAATMGIPFEAFNMQPNLIPGVNGNPGEGPGPNEYPGEGNPQPPPPPPPKKPAPKKKPAPRSNGGGGGGGGGGVNVPGDSVPNLFSNLPRPTQAATATSSGGPNYLLIVGIIAVAVIGYLWWKHGHKPVTGGSSAPPHPAE